MLLDSWFDAWEEMPFVSKNSLSFTQTLEGPKVLSAWLDVLTKVKSRTLSSQIVKPDSNVP
jgi:hypothetical protein